MEWVDVAGLAKNAHRGEGLGNQFLGTLRDCTCLCHVVRAFDDPNILVHQIDTDNNNDDDDDDAPSSSKLCDPLRDMETIHLELILADLAHVQRRLERINSKTLNDKDTEDSQEEQKVLEHVEVALQEGIPVRTMNLSDAQQILIRSMGLLTAKPIIYAFNVDEVDFLLNRPEAEEQIQAVLEQFESVFHPQTAGTKPPSFALVCANVESQLSLMTSEQQLEYLESIGMDTSLERPSLCYQVLPQLVMERLGYSIVYTGPGVPPERSQTTRAHLVKTPLTAYDFAGRIHRDIQKGFIKAQVIQVPQLLEQASDYVHAKELGILRTEGKDYLLQNGDTICIQWKG
jgi:ribosome-binding ATPase YchF (GTP1/OBG family)